MPYPIPPGPRIAYDLDGSVGLAYSPSQGSWVDLPELDLRALNNERGAAGLGGSSGFGWDGSSYDPSRPPRIVIIFPHEVRLQGVLRLATGGSRDDNSFQRPRLRTSVNSTNGVDGDWITVLEGAATASGLVRAGTPRFILGGTANFTSTPSLNDYYRRPLDTNLVGIEALSGAGTRHLRAVEITLTTQVQGSPGGGLAFMLHLYGVPDTGAIENRVEFWRPSLDLRLAPGDLDWGDVPLSSSGEKSFRVRNMSETKTAVSMNIHATAGASTVTPAPEATFLFSTDDGVSWSSSISFASLSPGATTPEILMRRTTPSNAALSSWSPRVLADVGGWE